MLTKEERMMIEWQNGRPDPELSLALREGKSREEGYFPEGWESEWTKKAGRAKL